MPKESKTERLVREMFNHIVDSNRGIYMGQRFAETLNLEWCVGHVKGLTDEEWQTLLDGPTGDHDPEAYWLTVEKIDEVTVTTSAGTKYNVYWGDGIFLYPAHIQDEINWDELL